jgi:hypothetical protein
MFLQYSAPIGLSSAVVSPIVFDYYIAPNGDDNNVGSLASPWSITAINTKQSTYAGKKIGLIGDIAGTQTPIQYGTVGGVQTTLYSLCQAQNGQNQGCILNVQGGSSGMSPTLLASCNSSGVYTPRWAAIDASNPSGGAAPTVECVLMGQNAYMSSAVSQYGNVTYDALEIRNFTHSAIFMNSGGSGTTGFIAKNNYIHGASCQSGNNPGGIKIGGAQAPLITNNKIDNLTFAGGGGDTTAYGMPGVMSYASHAMVVTNNNLSRCGGFLTKDTTQDFANFSYNYVEHGNFGSIDSGGIISAGAITSHIVGSGATSVIHHNIFLGPLGMVTQDGTTFAGTVQAYNNTFYGTSSEAANCFQCLYGTSYASGGAVQFYNNLVYSVSGYDHGAAGGGSLFLASPAVLSNATFNTNVYGSNGNAVSFNRTYLQNLSLSGWQSAMSVDSSSVSISSTPFVSPPTQGNTASFATNSLAMIGGTTCGALDGSGTVGCSF